MSRQSLSKATQRFPRIGKRRLDATTSAPEQLSLALAGCASEHGVNRLGANSLLDHVVFGRQAADATRRVGEAQYSVRQKDYIHNVFLL